MLANLHKPGGPESLSCFPESCWPGNYSIDSANNAPAYCPNLRLTAKLEPKKNQGEPTGIYVLNPRDVHSIDSTATEIGSSESGTEFGDM